MSETQLSPRQIAEVRIAEEEAARREELIAAAEAEEEARRRAERAATEREERRRAAEADFDQLAVDRGRLEDRAQEELDRLLETLATINAIDTQQLRLARDAGKATPRTTFRGLWQGWIAGATLGHPDHWGGATLRERDPLATNPATDPEEERVPKGNVSPADPGLVQKCAGQKADGSACSLAPMDGSIYCVAHDPERASARSQAAHIAGRARHGLEA